MADVDFRTVQSTTSPLLEEILDGPDGNAMPLGGAISVDFRMSDINRAIAAVVVAATIVDAAAGKVRVQVPTTDAGDFDYQWIVTFSDGQVVAVPGDRYKRLTILPLLN